MRFYYVYPGEETAVPDYLKALPDYDETVGSTEGMRTVFPDWTHDELRRVHLQFYERFAARYDEDARIAFLQTGFGLWGEYHIYDGPRVIGETFPSEAFQAEFVRHLDAQFDTLHWSLSIDAAADEYSPFANDAALCVGGNQFQPGQSFIRYVEINREGGSGERSYLTVDGQRMEQST